MYAVLTIVFAGIITLENQSNMPECNGTISHDNYVPIPYGSDNRSGTITYTRTGTYTKYFGTNSNIPPTSYV